MKAIIEKYNIKAVWHFTDKANLKLIEKYGLLSLEKIEEKEINVPNPGGNDWSHKADKLKNLHKFVHLSFVDDHPMLYRLKKGKQFTDPIWLEIDSSVLFNSNVMFCPDVSNKSGVEILGAEKAKEKIDFEVLFTNMNWREPKINKRRQLAIKSEILIPNSISIEKINSYKNG